MFSEQSSLMHEIEMIIPASRIADVFTIIMRTGLGDCLIDMQD